MIDEPGAAERANLDAIGKPLRIAGIDPERNFGGGETQVLGLTRELILRGHSADLICDPDGDLARRALEAGVTCYPLRARNALDIAAGLRLRALLARGRYDVVHFHTARAHALAPYAAGVTRLRIVTRRMDYPPGRLLGPYLYNHAVDGVIAISRDVAQVLGGAGVRHDRIRVVPSGVDCERFAPPDAAAREACRRRWGLASNDIAIGAVGALVPRKAHRVLIDAVIGAQQQMVGQGTQLRCFIAGGGPLRDELIGRVREVDATDTIRMLGPLEDPRDLLAALDIFAMPSMNEGLGVAALEAMAMGLPVVASAVGGLREVVDEGVSGFLCRPGDAEDWARRLIDLAQPPGRARTVGRAGRERAVTRFSLQTMAHGTLGVYQELLHKRDAHRREMAG